jgi:hypothetical protein
VGGGARRWAEVRRSGGKHGDGRGAGQPQ